LSLAGCASKSPHANENPPTAQVIATEIPQAETGLRVTSSGTNQMPRFVPQSQKLYFLSKDRSPKLGWQLYELDFGTFRERRLTYQDGDIESFAISSSGQYLAFASTTDELKERPRALFPAQEKFPPTEIYLSDIRALHIDRVTEEPGYQGQVKWWGPETLLFASESKDSLEIKSLSLPKKEVETWSLPQNESASPLTKLSPTPALEIQELAAGSNLTRGLAIKKPATTAPNPNVLIWSRNKSWVYQFTRHQPVALPATPQWIDKKENTPSLVALIAKSDSELYTQGFLWDYQKNCHWVVASGKGNVRDLVVDSKNEKIAFTLELSESSQIFVRDFPSLGGECLPTTFMVPQISEPRSPAGDLESNLKTPLNCWEKVPTIQSCQIPW
jgi:Tol biopolymer transport system component